MLAYARLVPGPGFDLKRAALYYAQRLMPFPAMRRLVARGVAAAIARRHPFRTVIDGLARDVAASLEAKGYAVVPDLLGADEIAAMRRYLDAQPVVLRNGAQMALAEVPDGASIADYPLQTVLECPHMLRLVHAPFLMALAQAFLGCRPTISTIGIRWSFPGEANAATQNFHRDPDDWRFFKTFVYLSDVDDDCGPHLYVRGSQRGAGSWRARTFARAEVERRYGADAIVAVTGPAGTSFVADTWGVHAGPIPRAKPRLMLEIGYSVLPVYALRYAPLRLDPRPEVDPPEIDPYACRLLVA